MSLTFPYLPQYHLLCVVFPSAFGRGSLFLNQKKSEKKNKCLDQEQVGVLTDRQRMSLCEPCSFFIGCHHWHPYPGSMSIPLWVRDPLNGFTEDSLGSRETFSGWAPSRVCNTSAQSSAVKHEVAALGAECNWVNSTAHPCPCIPHPSTTLCQSQFTQYNCIPLGSWSPLEA